MLVPENDTQMAGRCLRPAKTIYAPRPSEDPKAMALEGIPEYPDSRQVALSDRARLETFFSEYPSEVSERTFGSVYIWRNYEHRSQLSQIDGHLLMSWFRERWGRVLFAPVGPRPVSVIERLAREPGLRGEFKGVFAVADPTASELRQGGLEPMSLRDEWDYVYLSEDLARLEGARYHSLRKEMAKAAALPGLVYEPMTSKHQRECLELEEVWCDLKHCTLDKFSSAEDQALKEAIANLEPLGFKGGVALLDGRVQALTVGERLNADTAVVHFEKANPEIRGLYQVINQQFCVSALKGFKFVNREQDVGEPGLRRAKEGYHPHHMVEKYFLRF